MLCEVLNHMKTMRNSTATQSPRNYPIQNLCIRTNAFHIMRFLFHNSNA